MVANHLQTIDWSRLFEKGRLAIVALITFITFSLATVVLNAAEATSVHDFDEYADQQLSSVNDSSFNDPEAAAFDQWDSIVEDDSQMHWEQPDLKPIDWVRHFGFRHSSSHGRHVGKGLPLKGTSVMNRPLHFDWFVGPLLGDDLISDRVTQGNVLLGGIRLGWDFDHYWGLEWRFGWADPQANYVSPEENGLSDISYVVSDIDLIYYPWGDSKVRPFFLVGIGATQLDFYDENSLKYDTTLATIPFGGGIQFCQTSWLTWRFDIIDNLAIGDDRVATLHNISITAGMEMRFGARPSTYWPWRSSRKVW